jgi:hypothetical protein
MFRQQGVILRGFMTKEYKNITSIYTFKKSHIKNPKHKKAFVCFGLEVWILKLLSWIYEECIALKVTRVSTSS